MFMGLFIVYRIWREMLRVLFALDKNVEKWYLMYYIFDIYTQPCITDVYYIVVRINISLASFSFLHFGIVTWKHTFW